MKLFDSAFSPFARKVRMVLEYKGLEFQAIDGLLKSNHAELKAVNGRVEVPTLVDGDTVVVNSADIVSYLEHRYPDRPVYPAAPDARVHARAWERAADTFIDPILVDISYWKWADRPDTMPAGLLEAARADLALVYDALEARTHGARVHQRTSIHRRHRALSAHCQRAGDGGRPFARPASKPRSLVHANAIAPGLRCRPAARPRLHCQPRRRGIERHKDLLARRPHRVATGTRFPRLVLQRDTRATRPLAGPRHFLLLWSRATGPDFYPARILRSNPALQPARYGPAPTPDPQSPFLVLLRRWTS